MIEADKGSGANIKTLHYWLLTPLISVRMLIPQMGPIPLGFDLAFPISYADGDRLRYFNFSMSAMY